MDMEILFRQSATGLYFHDMSNHKFVLINTVKESREGFTQIQYKGAKQVQWAMAMVVSSYEKEFNNTVCVSVIPNFPVTLEDIKSSHTIFVPDVPSLKVKIARQQTKPVMYNYVNISHKMLYMHHMVSVVADVKFFNGEGFLVIISMNIKFTTVQYFGKRMARNLSKPL